MAFDLCCLYVIWIVVLLVLTHKIGKFNPIAIIINPILVIFFTVVLNLFHFYENI